MDFLLKHLLCPHCREGGLILEQGQLRCRVCASIFCLAGGKPVLLSQCNEMFPPNSYLAKPPFKNRGKEVLAKFIPSPSVNINLRENLRTMAKALQSISPAHILVVGSGQQKPQLDKFFSEYPELELLYCDVDREALVDFYCDAHQLPFKDASFNGIIITAVLEHVLDPDKVVGEIGRVLVDGGIIYSEIPFMQQVHAGAYDFNRYSISGHRKLFNHFEEIRVGVAAGPATALVWAIEHFALYFAWSKGSRTAIKAITRLLFFWLKYFDYLFRNSPQAFDGASCTYFLGKKGSGLRPDKNIVKEYPGAGY